MPKVESKKLVSKKSPSHQKNISQKQKAARSKKKSKETIWEAIARLRAQIPIREWDKLPTDLARNIDHYLYGHPKNS
jgi:hypothetical protein